MAINLSDTTRPRLYRISYIDSMIKTNRFPNSRSLSLDLGVSPRTVLRDVEFMKDSLYAPLEYSASKRGFYYSEANYTMGLLKLTEGELLSLYLGHTLLAKCKGTPYVQPVINAFYKICSYLQETVDIDFGRLSESIIFDLEPLRGDEERVTSHFTDVGNAIINKNSIKILHYSIEKDIILERMVDPYHVRYFQGAWYLVGYCHLRQSIRIFALDRIKKIYSTVSTFTPPGDFNPDEYFSDSFQLFKGPDIYHVRIHFSSDQARWIKERQWHPTQEIEENPDGSLVFSMQTSGLVQVKKWVLSFGSEARALAPPALVREVRDELVKTREMYN